MHLRLPFLLLLALCSRVLSAIYERLEDLPTLNFDYIIVGGGTAGNVIANRLTEDPDVSALVLEAGESTADVLLSQVPFFFPRIVPGTVWDWNFTTTEQPGLNGLSVPLPRGFGLGGCSAVNAMFYTRGSSQDYDRYAQISGDPGWGWDALQPYFRKNERFVAPADHHNTTGQFNPVVHGFDGITDVSLPGYPRATDSLIIQATSELPDDFPFNLDYNSGYQLGIGWTPMTVGNGTRSSSQTSYLGPVYIGRPNLHVLVHTRVTRILQSDTKDISRPPTFNAVELTQDAGVTTHTLAPTNLKEIVLSAGSIGTPNILLHSGIGDTKELTALHITPTLHLPDVGKNFTDHPIWSMLFIVNNTDTIENIYFRNVTFQADALAEWEANRTGFLTAGAANQLGFLRIPDDAGVVEGEPCAGNETAHYEFILSNGVFRDPIPPTGNFFSVRPAVMCPLSRGNVTINSTNPLDPPLINPNFLSHPQDLAIMQYAIASAQKFVTAAPVWDGYILGLVTNTTEDDIRNGTASLFHPVGSASMSPVNADWGVVDPDLVLKGAKGVRIVDASVLPFLPAAHTQVPVYVFAERAADLIKAAR
ncbi:pyranose dehydrogenase [Guyanagaster necrorhizus]|uniref:Pyranose dehydrogenase n=1 Tax=Guyanagaster necrorhizus TaxID=856835 RepID=A0A9P7VQ56_9AGAR|nr:pyranose dehydrogenase [Guyanagaster necrorhizus MCA 3950]KAG7445363.1 pyranose dehydrogenase [Guyanagaster necrorhizus MCA 3950]